MLMQKRLFRGRPRTVSVYIPSQYILRPSKANRVVWILLTPLALFLSGYCLTGTLAAGFGFLRLGLFFGGGLLFLILFTILTLLLFAALMLVCPLLAVKSRKDSLTVDGEQLVLRRWLRKPLAFRFSDVACVRARQGRETIVLLDRNGRPLCRLPVTMEHMDAFQADLRSRRTPFLDRGAPIAEVFLLSPGPRREEITLDLPGVLPEYYCLAYPPGLTGIFAVLLAFCCIGMLFCLPVEPPAALCLLPFVFLAGLGLIWVRRERLEIIGDRIRSRDLRGRTAEISFSDAAAVRIQTTATGIGPLSSFQILDAAGKPLIRPGVGMRGSEYLLADLIDRGIPFTY